MIEVDGIKYLQETPIAMQNKHSLNNKKSNQLALVKAGGKTARVKRAPNPLRVRRHDGLDALVGCNLGAPRFHRHGRFLSGSAGAPEALRGLGETAGDAVVGL
jgi:hypothetical protein